MYQIIFASRRTKKKFDKIVKETKDPQEKSLVETAFKHYPKGKKSTHKFIGKVKDFWKYDLPQGERITYKVYDEKKCVVVYFIGSHDDYMKFLKKGR